jgi:transcriptional regulator with XRE-family HTH domain
MTDPRKALGDFIRNHRLRASLSINELAEKSGVSIGYLSMIENGKCNAPQDDKLTQVAYAIEREPQDLIYLADLVRTPASIRKRLRELEAQVARSTEAAVA